MSHNVFEDFDSIFRQYERMAGLNIKITYEDVNLINLIVNSPFAIRVLSDPYWIIREHLEGVASQLGIHLIDIQQQSIDHLICTIEQQRQNYTEIIVTGVGFRRREDSDLLYTFLSNLT